MSNSLRGDLVPKTQRENAKPDALSSFKAWFPSITKNKKDTGLKYVDLAPTDKADESGIYSDALTQATENPNVSNIALTGPYGSGKSSVIKTFLKKKKKRSLLKPIFRTRYKKTTLQISLAAFLPEADGSVTKDDNSKTDGDSDKTTKKGNVSKQEIERSILQQMLYGADANSLPLSRFKRIQSPKWWHVFFAPFIIFGLFACWILVQKGPEILTGAFFIPLDFTNWFNLTSFAAGIALIWLSLYKIYVKSFGVSLKSFSLKDMEITPVAANEESILNRHLDEIIYFFQSTKYDLVIIEDLDRFNNPDIFVTLREINSLINANAGVKRKIRFLYALRDNMFVNTDRTKFFEFIVPIIPIINSSNSIDKVIEQQERLSLDERLSRQFLREVSRYLDDLRLIHNIFNEYAIYVANLETDGENILDANKLLAILIYKNVLPSDFEELHREKGKLANILNRHDAFIAEAETRYKTQISGLEQKISDAEKQVPSDLEELRKIYAMALIAKVPQNYTYVGLNGNQKLPLNTIVNREELELLIDSREILVWNQQGNTTRVNLGDLQDEVNAENSYQERKAKIENKSEKFRDSFAETVRELRAKILNLRTAKFDEIIRTNAKDTEDLFNAFGENRELIRFLVFEGYLDDTYYQYTSLFHKGRLSPNDNKYLIQIRAFSNTEPGFQIDNPKEVIAAMRDEDFRQEFVLNKTLVDCMFGNQGEYGEKIAKLIDFVSLNFDACDDFFSTYYERGKFVSELMTALIEKWPSFVSTAISSPENITHVARMLAHLPEKHLETLHQKDSKISDFISTNLAEILGLEIDFEPGRLALLHFETKELKSIGPYPAIARLLYDEGLYEVSKDNLEFIFGDVLGSTAIGDLQTKHYSTVLESEEEALVDKVERDFDRYLKNILLQSESNTEEGVSAIIKVINQDEIESEHLEKFIEKQSAKLPSLDQIPATLHSLMFRLRKIEASWENCLAFIASEEFDAETFTAFLRHDETSFALSLLTFDYKETALPLCRFLINNNGFEADTYRTYVRTLPIQFKTFPKEIDSEKLRILIEEEKISFSSASFPFLTEYEDLLVLFVAKNIEAYFENSDEYAIDDDFREKLLDSDVSDEQKLKIIDEMDLTLIPGLASRASVIGQILNRTGADVSQLTGEAAQAIITNSNPIATQLTLSNKLQSTLSDEQVRETILQLPWPFCEIKPGWGQPKIPNTPENREFVSWLEARSIISSSKLTFLKDKIRIHNFRR